jgi:ureidoacrylate peracid hydrolase
MPDKTGALAPEIPWASIIGMRNILIHGYFEIDTDIVPELTPQASDDVISKTRFSGFFETDLDACLKKLGVTHLIITGCNTSICVNSTVRDGMFRDYLPVLLADCMSEPIGHGSPRSNHDASLLNAEVLLGWVSDSERFLKAVQP